MVLTAFAVLPRGTLTGFAAAASASSAPANATMYGPGLAVVQSPNGQTIASDMATFTRWDGVVEPYADLNASSAQWPYLANDTGSALVVTADGGSFTQGKAANASYEMLPTEIKETITIASNFPPIVTSPAIAVPFSSSYLAIGNGSAVALLGSSGQVVWTTAPFVAWDSANPAARWANPVSSLSYVGGNLVLALNTALLAQATYPLYLDPTWTLGATAGWGASTFANTTTDVGDGSVKIGSYADDFNNNQGTGWSIIGPVTFSGGTMNLGNTGNAYHSASWTYVNYQFDANFATHTSGTDKVDFYMGCTSSSICNTAYLEVSQSGSLVSLHNPSGGTLGQFSATINTGTWYTARVQVLQLSSTTYNVFWNGVQKFSATSTSAPASGGIDFAATTPSTVSVDNVRVWTTNSGTLTTPVRNAGIYDPLSVQAGLAVTAYNQTHLSIRSSADNVTWGPWTVVKADMGSLIGYSVTDQDRRKYYQLRLTLTTGVNGTPALFNVTTTEGTPSTNPASNTGFEAWYPYVGGLVNAVNGNVWYSTKDISFQGRAFGMAIQRAYNSALGSQVGPFGNGWTFNDNEKLVVNANLTITWNDGTWAQQLFSPKGTTGGYAAPRGVPSRLMKNGDGSYALWRVDGSRETFDSGGKLTSVVDRNGNKLTLAYSSGLLTSVTDDAGRKLSFSYDANNRIVSIKDPINRFANYSYDGSGNLIQFRDPMGSLTNYTYASGKLASIVDPVGKKTSFTYDGSSRATAIWLGFYQGGSVVWQFREYALSYNSSTMRAVQDARGYWTTLTLDSFGNAIALGGPPIGCACDTRGNSSSYTWDGEMNQIARADGRGNTWTMTYGFRANLFTTTDPGGNVSLKAWLEVNNATNYFVVPSASTTFRGFTTTYGYDGKGNRVSVTDPGGNVTRYGYDSSGFLNNTVSPRGFTTWTVYNASGYLVKREDALSETTTYAYDAIGRQTSATDPTGFVTSTAFDADSRVTKVTDPLGNFTTYQYNGRGDRIQVTDPDGATTAYAYNVTNDKVQTTTDSGGNVSRHAYDLRGNLNATTDADSHTTYYRYDSFERLTRIMTPLNYATNYVYDAAGNRIARTDGNGATTKYAYDKLERLEATMYPGPPVYGSPQTLTWAHDKDGNRISAIGFGYTETYGFDRSDRLESSVFNYSTYSVTTTYAYDADGNKATMTLGAATTKYFYDRLDRLTGILDPEGQNTTYSYDKDSRQTSKKDPSGVITTSLYDKASRLTAMYTNTSGGAVLESFVYAYDKAGLRTSETDVQSGNTTTTSYAYDKVHRLYKTTTGSSTTTDTYDAVGNVAMETKSSAETFTYDADNELTNASFSTTNYVKYTNDKNGNRVKATTAGGATTAYSYDYENRLLSTNPGCTYTYAPTGERVTSSCASGTTDLAYDPNVRGGSNLLATYTSAGSQTARYLDASGMNTPVEVYQGGNHYAYQTDALGSVRMLTGGSQNATDTYSYDAWGNVSAHGGTVANPLQYTSSLHDSSSGLDDMRARFYDSSANGGHRFLSPDSLSSCSGPNQYAYVRDTPLNDKDPTGRWDIWCLLGTIFNFNIVDIVNNFLAGHDVSSWDFVACGDVCGASVPAVWFIVTNWWWISWGIWAYWEFIVLALLFFVVCLVCIWNLVGSVVAQCNR